MALPTVKDLLLLVPLGVEGFAREVGGWVLVGKIAGGSPPARARTGSVNVSQALRDSRGQLEAILDPDFAALPIKKRAGNSFADTVLIGRAASNDICLPHSSVSKLHARITSKGFGPVLEDAGSSNGTLLNGDPVGAGADVGHGDLVRFGSIVFQCFEPGRLHGLLVRLPPDRG